MNMKVIGGIAILALLALIVWLHFSNFETQTGDQNATTTALQAAKAADIKPAAKAPSKGVPNSQTSYKSLLTQTGSYECDYEQVQDTGQGRNVIYLYGGKMRGEFRTSNADGSMTSNLFVYDGRDLYQWKEGSSVGTKAFLSSLSGLPFVIPKDLTSGAIVGDNYQSVGWLCHSWLTNKALLAPPSYVTFK